MDSLDLVEIIMEFERGLGVQVSAEDAARLSQGTASDLWRLVVSLRGGAAPAGPPPAQDPTWRKVRVLLARVLGVPVDDIGPDRPLGG